MAINRPDTFSPPADIGTAVVKNGGTDVTASLSGESEVDVTESLPSVTIALSESYHSVVYQSTLNDGKASDGGIYFNFTPFTQDLTTYSTEPLAWTDDALGWSPIQTQTDIFRMRNALCVSVETKDGDIRPLAKGIFARSGDFSSVAIGSSVYWLARTAGTSEYYDVNTFPASVQGDILRRVGYCLFADSSKIIIYFNPEPNFVQVP